MRYLISFGSKDYHYEHLGDAYLAVKSFLQVDKFWFAEEDGKIFCYATEEDVEADDSLGRLSAHVTISLCDA